MRKMLNFLGAQIKETRHFQERLIQRFAGDVDHVEEFISSELGHRFERTIQKAIEKLPADGKPHRYTHPTFGITVVINKLGMNGGELVTCWKGEEEQEW